jgi:2-methylcitrate dehydratase PrpD
MRIGGKLYRKDNTSMAGSLTQTLAHFASSLRYEDLPQATIDAAKRLTLDCLGTALAARALGAGCHEVLAVMRELGGTPQSSIIGDSAKISAPNAAFANGALVHALNFDPVGENVGHTGVVCLAAPLAIAQARAPVTGREFLTAAVVASEIFARVISPALQPKRLVYEALLTGQYFAYFGAAAGAGRVLGLDPVKMQSAFGLALMQVSGTRQVLAEGDAPAKAIYGAYPNHSGVLAALLAEAGLGAEIDALDGKAGFYVMTTGVALDPKLATDGLGTHYRFLETQFKPWPTSGIITPFIEAALELCATHDLKPDDIEHVGISCTSWMRQWCEPIAERRSPSNAAAAANSIQFAIAKALVHRRVVLSDFTPEGLKDEAARNMAQKIDHRFDESAVGGDVAVRTTGGSELRTSVETPLGDPRRPMSRERLIAKFRDCCSYVDHLQEKDVDVLISLIDNLEDVNDVSALAAAPKGIGN